MIQMEDCSHFVAKCYNLHLVCSEGSSAAKLCELAFGMCFPIDF